MLPLMHSAGLGSEVHDHTVCKVIAFESTVRWLGWKEPAAIELQERKRVSGNRARANSGVGMTVSVGRVSFRRKKMVCGSWGSV